MLGHRLSRHVMSLAKLAQGLPVPRMEAVEKRSADWVGQRLEHCIHAHGQSNRQLFGCLSTQT
jgi:hypothetical protein